MTSENNHSEATSAMSQASESNSQASVSASDVQKQVAAESTSAAPQEKPLTPSERFRIYNDNIKDGLRNGIQFTKHLDQLTETNDTDDLLAAATKLFDFTMNTDFVNFPHQYSAADYYLLFMGRLLELHAQSGVVLQSASDHEELSMHFAALGAQPTFKFVLVGGTNGGAFFTDKSSGLHLFYLNLEHKQLRFNSKAFTDLFAVSLISETVADRMKAINSLITFGKDLEKDYHFSVDYNLLAVENNVRYPTRHAILPAGTVDKLFVASADSNYMLQNAPEGHGAIIELDDGLTFGVAQTGTETAPQWVLTTEDSDGKISLMQVLLQYDFIREWYLANRSDLEIQSDPLIFA
ncbi:hypothetical protein [Furfurilactobacillus siliginis]|uniref:Uncharacterized protein n=1 Tax=Furfurilactobacillus siliginis TaxID=348151 RepID=A0A0R2L070_9LACO|nr:hypothetical protein [Furfurilactobacillus siliginis]KRN95058.1 hypothetical protein IV55_GL000339 [Furfurilactobacillus siliginis]GEK28312.1 hypothetical protein LSI01_06230 [Furfurilactobacillus siliginis]